MPAARFPTKKHIKRKFRRVCAKTNNKIGISHAQPGKKFNFSLLLQPCNIFFMAFGVEKKSFGV